MHKPAREVVAKLNEIRRESRALRDGDYLPLWNDHFGICFIRKLDKEAVLVAVNSRPSPMRVKLELPFDVRRERELLGGSSIEIQRGRGKKAELEVPPRWAAYFELDV